MKGETMPKVKTPKPKKVKKLDPLREKLAVLVDQANARVYQLRNANKPVESRALIEAERTKARQYSRDNEEELFKSQFSRTRELKREYARVQAFLNDYTSTLEGAQNWSTNLADLKGAFGSQWRATTGKNYDTSRINEDVAKEAFRLYRMTVEAAGGWERAVGIFHGVEGILGYGSENLINAIYDATYNYMNGGQIQLSDENATTILSTAYELVESAIHNYDRIAELQSSNEDYGELIPDNTKKAKQNWYRIKKERYKKR